RRAARGSHGGRHRPPARDGRSLRLDRPVRGRPGRRVRPTHLARRRPGVTLLGAASHRARAGGGLMRAFSVSDDTIGTGRFLWRMATYRTGSYVSDTILWIAFYASRLLPGLVAQRGFDALQHGTADVGAVLWFAALFVGAGVTQAGMQVAGW